MSEDQIQGAIEDHTTAAKNAIRAGFDGVEIHVPMDTLSIKSFRIIATGEHTDGNRALFGIQVAAIANAIGADKVGYRVSRWGSFQGMRMPDPVTQFSYLIEELKGLKLGYLHVMESRVNNNDIWGHISPVLIAGGFDAHSAKSAVDSEYRNNDIAVVFGRHFRANPDLPFRIQYGLDLNKYDRPSFYTPMTRTGYTDYPFSADYLDRNNV
ncbi:hypothetical protein N7465_000940 [Penicillium sp. CMV-2018d]|nr:hypothetical protein N7465_000940 [Penicillium sp. CMV-2018d]